MTPFVLIGIVALIGLIGWGLNGLFIAALCSYLVALLLGWILKIISGGLLPRKLRAAVAFSFALQHPDLVSAAFPGRTSLEQERLVEAFLERVIVRSVVDNTSPNADLAFDRTAVQAAASACADEEEHVEKKALLTALAAHLDRELY